MIPFPVYRSLPHGDIWAIWRYVKTTPQDSGSPDRIMAYCDRWGDAYDIAESLNGSELFEAALFGELR